MELEKMEFNFQSKSTDGKTSISERPENINVIGNEEFDVIIKNDGLLNIYNLRGNQRSSTFRKIVQSNFDINMPNKTGGVEINDGKHLLQVSPDEWIILSNSNNIDKQVLDLEKKLKKIHYALTNLTDQYQVINISGEKSRWVLSKGCSIDLDPSVFGPKVCCQTTLALTDITLCCISKNSFILFFRNSFANYLLDWIEDASFDCKYKFVQP